MELINERELGILGERYDSFLEAYRVNGNRRLNACVAPRGDGASQGLMEADEGIVFSPDQTRHALLYGSDLFSGRYKEMRKRVRKTLFERYEWTDEDRFGADVRGDNVIMERYAIGHPEAFHRKRRTQRRKRSVAILYDAMCPASTPVSKRIEAGCIVVACADALERMGYEVALDFCLATYDGNSMSDDPTLLLEVALKGYGDALNPKRLEFPLAAKPVLFHLGVWWAHRFPQLPADFGEGEGYPVSYDANRVRALEEHARRRHGAYLSEDIIEMQLGMDPTKTLERILGAIGEASVLEEHMAGKTTMQAADSPAQGKLFGGTRVPGAEPNARMAPGAGDSGASSGAGGAANRADADVRDVSTQEEECNPDTVDATKPDGGRDVRENELPRRTPQMRLSSDETHLGSTPKAGKDDTGADVHDGDARPGDGSEPAENDASGATGQGEDSRLNGGTGAMAAGNDRVPDGPLADDPDTGGDGEDDEDRAGGQKRPSEDETAAAHDSEAESKRSSKQNAPGVAETEPEGNGIGSNGADAGSDNTETETSAGSGGKNARRPTAEGRQDRDDVEPGSDGMVGFGGLTGTPGAASSANKSGKPEPRSNEGGDSPHPGNSPRSSEDGDAGQEGGTGGAAHSNAQPSDSRSEQPPGSGGSGSGPGAGGTDGTAPREGSFPDAEGVQGGSAGTANGSGAASPSSNGTGAQEGGGASGDSADNGDEPEEGRDQDEPGAPDETTGTGEQGESMSDNPYERHDPDGPGDMDPAEDQQPDGTGHDAIPDMEEPPQGGQDQEDLGDHELEEPARDSFIVELRKRYVRFERGDYRKKKERESRRSQVAASATGPVKAPPIRAVTGADDYEFGTPRSTPFSMNYVPKRKG